MTADDSDNASAILSLFREEGVMATVWKSVMTGDIVQSTSHRYVMGVSYWGECTDPGYYDVAIDTMLKHNWASLSSNTGIEMTLGGDMAGGEIDDKGQLVLEIVRPFQYMPDENELKWMTDPSPQSFVYDVMTCDRIPLNKGQRKWL